MPSLYIVKHSIIFSCFHKTFVCQAQWMPETSHSQWRNRTSCLPWNYQGSAAEVGTMCDINWITLRSFCISNKCLDVVNMFLKAGMQPRTFRSFVLRFYLISTCWQHKDPALGYCQGMNMVVQSRASWKSYIGRYLLPGWVKFPTEAALFAVAAQSQAEAWWAWRAWWAWLWRSKQPFLRNTSIVIHWLNLVDGRAITRNPTHQQMKMQWNMKAHPHIRHIIYK